MLEMNRQNVVDNDLMLIFNSIREASKVISKLVQEAPLRQAELLGLEGEVNVQGEDQKKLDVITNDVLKSALQYTGKLGTLASEEEDNPVPGERSDGVLADTGNYVCCFDPLDGSSNVDAGIAVGTIFGIFKEPDADECIISDGNMLSGSEVECLAGALQPGKALVAAGYVLYSSSTEMVFTLGKGCVGFTLDAGIGEFVLTRPSMKIPPRGKIYSLNEANIDEWDEPMRKYVKAVQSGKGETGIKYSARYIGSMVGDVHRTLLYGGIFAYPSDSKNKDGKLRLLYEAAPMSFVLEQAGGKAITGYSRVMDIPPKGVHQRVPVILGSPDDVSECQKYFLESEDPALKEKCMKRLEPAVA
jgi:fructose-1,6-bisphosphatase I